LHADCHGVGFAAAADECHGARHVAGFDMALENLDDPAGTHFERRAICGADSAWAGSRG
jgi:hypothetical protein